MGFSNIIRNFDIFGFKITQRLRRQSANAYGSIGGGIISLGIYCFVIYYGIILSSKIYTEFNFH